MSTPSLADRFFVEAMSPAFRDDPYPHYERFRGPNPLLRVADTIWFALGHGDVTNLLRHPGMSTDESHATTEIGKTSADTRGRRFRSSFSNCRVMSSNVTELTISLLHKDVRHG